MDADQRAIVVYKHRNGTSNKRRPSAVNTEDTAASACCAADDLPLLPTAEVLAPQRFRRSTDQRG